MMRRKRLTRLRRPLFPSARQTIQFIIRRRQRQTLRWFTSKEVITVSKIHQIRQSTNTLRNLTGKIIMSHIQHFQTHSISILLWQRPQKLVETDIKHSQILQQPYFFRQTRLKTVIHRNNLIQSCHITNPSWQTTVETVVSQYNN